MKILPEEMDKILTRIGVSAFADKISVKLHGYSINIKNVVMEVKKSGDLYDFKMYGSVTKFIKGNNYEVVTHEDIKEYYKYMKNLIGFDIGRMSVRRLEVGATLETPQEPKIYLCLFKKKKGGKKYFYNPVQQKHESKYLKYRDYEAVLYDKGVEANTLPDEMKNKNLFRMEIKYTKRIRSQTEIETFADILNPKKYRGLVKQWYNFFNECECTTDKIGNVKKVKPSKVPEVVLQYLMKDPVTRDRAKDISMNIIGQLECCDKSKKVAQRKFKSLEVKSEALSVQSLSSCDQLFEIMKKVCEHQGVIVDTNRKIVTAYEHQNFRNIKNIGQNNVRSCLNLIEKQSYTRC
ncbi:hypothetical protein ACFO3G_03270 [Falsiporphyromonas endometrii]|uniref:Uncharacterized protein n=2 Tax=Falsiporphyromonas endometrii TaxID=1387297 RepID=A0ABV9K680_9PORP